MLSYCNAASDHGVLVTEIDGKLEAMHENKQLVDLMSQMRVAIQKRERLIQAIKTAMKL